MRWVTMEVSLKKNPLDAEPTADGNIVITNDQDNLARAVRGDERTAFASQGFQFYRSHFVTCPDSPVFRKKPVKS